MKSKNLRGGASWARISIGLNCTRALKSPARVTTGLVPASGEEAGLRSGRWCPAAFIQSFDQSPANKRFELGSGMKYHSLRLSRICSEESISASEFIASAPTKIPCQVGCKSHDQNGECGHDKSWLLLIHATILPLCHWPPSFYPWVCKLAYSKMMSQRIGGRELRWWQDATLRASLWLMLPFLAMAAAGRFVVQKILLHNKSG